MLALKTFTFNDFQENTYLIVNDVQQCWIVDPGMYDKDETNTFFDYIDSNKLIPQAIINTHAHLDHIFGARACKERYGISFMVHEKELPILKNASVTAAIFGLSWDNAPVADQFIEDGKTLKLGEDELDVRFAPGHSPGSVVFYHAAGKWVIGGDVLFNGSIGRTDLPGGNYEVLIKSIREHLLTLPDDTTVYPGHGPATEIGRERSFNPFLQG